MAPGNALKSSMTMAPMTASMASQTPIRPRGAGGGSGSSRSQGPRSGIRLGPRSVVEAFHQAARYQAPAVDEDEEDQLERQADHHRREHHHSHAHPSDC